MRPRTPHDWRRYAASIPTTPPPAPSPDQIRAEESDAKFFEDLEKLARRGIIGRFW